MEQKERNTAHSKKSVYILIAILASVAVVVAVLFTVALSHVPSSTYVEGVGEVSLSAATEHEREDFFAQFGYKAESLESTSVIIPSEGEVYEEYNELQEEQGLSLEPFCGKRAQQYILKLDKKSDEGNLLFGVLTVYRDRVVAAHLTDFIYSEELPKCLPLCSFS